MEHMHLPASPAEHDCTRQHKNRPTLPALLRVLSAQRCMHSMRYRHDGINGSRARGNSDEFVSDPAVLAGSPRNRSIQNVLPTIRASASFTNCLVCHKASRHNTTRKGQDLQPAHSILHPCLRRGNSSPCKTTHSPFGVYTHMHTLYSQLIGWG